MQPLVIHETGITMLRLELAQISRLQMRASGYAAHGEAARRFYQCGMLICSKMSRLSIYSQSTRHTRTGVQSRIHTVENLS
jgi:hypothetical protein